MKISDILAQRQSFSYEIFPPKGDMSVEQAEPVATELCKNHPDWISVTFSAGGSGNSGAPSMAEIVARSIAGGLAARGMASLITGALGANKKN